MFYVELKGKIFFVSEFPKFYWTAVAVLHIYPFVTGQRQTLTIEKSAHFLLQLYYFVHRESAPA